MTMMTATSICTPYAGEDDLPSVYWAYITPEEARELIDTRNKGNFRRLRMPWVSQYAGDMKKDVWHITGATITFDKRGRLMDGQHRVLACALSGIPLVTLVVEGVDARAALDVDRGKARSFSDYLAFMGEINTTTLGTMVRTVALYDGNHLPLQVVLSHETLFECLENNPGVRDSVALTSTPQFRRSPGTKSHLAACHYLTSRVDPEGAGVFVEKYVTGAGLKEGDPVLALLRWNMRVASRASHGKVQMPPRIAVILKAMNAWRQGKTMQTVGWKASEAFPRVWEDPTVGE